MFGNHRAAEQFEITKKLVRLLGIDEKRLRLEWISAAEGARWARIITEFVEDVKKLGPSPIRVVKKQEGRSKHALAETGDKPA